MKRILVPLSGDDSHEAIVPLIGHLARQSGATVRLLRVFPVPELIRQSPDFAGAPGRVAAYADQQMAVLTSQGLDYLRAVELQLDGITVEAVVRFGDPGQETLIEAETFGADLVAVATTS
ncbi:MAG: universal stress protein, partial [bacterium]